MGCEGTVHGDELGTTDLAREGGGDILKMKGHREEMVRIRREILSFLIEEWSLDLSTWSEKVVALAELNVRGLVAEVVEVLIIDVAEP